VAYHITQRGVDRQSVFFSASDREFYLGLLRDNRPDAAVRILAYCLMPNHVHFIAVPEGADSLAVLFRRVHGRYAQYLNVKKQRTGHLWQNRFFSCPLSETHLWAALRYVERNPVRAGQTTRVEEYRWSSARAHHSGKDSSGVLDLAFWNDAGGAERWTGLHATPEELVQLRLLRRCTYAGRPFGDETFVDALEQRFQRKWRRWSFELPGRGATQNAHAGVEQLGE
jgi:putative transposase